MSLIGRLKKMNPLHFFWIIPFGAEVIALATSVALSLLWRGGVSGELVLFGSLSAFFISLAVSTVIVYVLRHSNKLSWMNVELATQALRLELAEKELKRNMAKFQTAFYSNVAAISIAEFETMRYVEINQGFTDIFGLTPEEVIGKTPLEAGACIEGEEQLLNRNQLLWEYGSVRNNEIKIGRKSGEIGTALYSAELIFVDGKAHVLSFYQDITERKAAEEALKRSEKRYRMLYDNTPAMLRSVDSEQRLTDVNKRWLQTLGYERDEVIGRKFQEFLTESSRKYADTEMLPQFYRDGFVENVSYQVVKKNGEVIDALFTAQADRDEHGRIIGSVAVIEDITERKRAELILRESEERYRTLVEESFDGVIVDDGHRIIFANSRAAEMVGFDRDDLVGLDFRVLTHPNFQSLLQKRSMLRHETVDMPSKYEVKLLRRNGEAFDAEINSRAIEIEGEKYIQNWVRDISDRKKAEMALRESEALHRLITENATDIIVRQSVDNRVLYVSDSVLKILGYSPDEIVGRPVVELFQSDELVGVENALAAMSRDRGDLLYRFPVRAKSGDTIWLETGGKAITDPASGEFQGVVTVSRDITARIKSEEDLRASEKKYRELVESISEAIFTIDSAGAITYVSPAIETILGYHQEDVIGRPFSDLVYADDLTRLQVEFIEALEEEGYPSEYRLVSRSGEPRWVQSNSQPFYEGDRLVGIRGVLTDVTERKLAELELIRSQTTLSTILDSMPFGVMVVDINRVIRQANASALELAGYDTLDQTTGQSCEEILCLQEDGLCPVLDKGETIDRKECSLVTRDGREIAILKSVVRVNIEGEDLLIEGFLDLTERKKAEEALRESEENFRQIIEHMPDMFYRADMSGKLVMSNHEGVKLLGYDNLDDLIGVDLAQTFYQNPEDRQRFLEELLREGSVRDYMVIMRHRDGSPMWVQVNSHFIYDKSGNPAGVEGIARDVTKQVIAQQELQESRERYRFLVENAPLGIGSMDPTGALVDANPMLLRLIGLEQGIAETNVLTYQPLVKAGFASHFRQCLNTGMSVVSENRYMSGSGNNLWLRYYLNPIRDDAEELIGVLTIFEDLTEEKRLRQESEYRQQQIIQADKLASLGEVVAGVAHEVNNPNSFIAYNLPMLEETWDLFVPILEDYARTNPKAAPKGLTFDELFDDMRDIIEAIRTGSSRINAVVSSLKDYVRLDDGHDFKDVQVNDVINKALIIVGAQVRKSAANVEIDLAPDLPLIPGRFQKLEQVVTNLVVNAANSIPNKNEGRLCIRTRFCEHLNSIAIMVEDNGSGMSAPVLNRVFEPFFTSRRETGGTGLGLSVSLKLIQEHNGTIGVLSREGIGSRFTVFLPLNQKTRLDLQPSILCVDDDPMFRDVMRTFFNSVYEKPFTVFGNPENLLSYLEVHPEVDIVLSDVVMPEMSGWDLLDQIKERFPLVYVVLFSGFDEEASVAREHQPDYYLKKPFELKTLIDLIGGMERQRL
jgi:PAS domain S-box-containing protein